MNFYTANMSKLLPWMRILSIFINTCMKLERCGPVLISTHNKLSFFQSQSAYTTALIMMMETINLAILVMDTFHAAVMFYQTSALVWDSLKGRCEYNSSTCDPKHLPKLNWTFNNCLNFFDVFVITYPIRLSIASW